MLDETDKGKIFVWGNFGKEIKKLDEKRLLAICQNNPDYFLSLIYCDELEKIFNKLLSEIDELEKDEMVSDEILNAIFENNKLHDLFNEINDFLTQSNDMISIGSFLTGEFDKSGKLADILRKEKDGN